MARRKAPAVQAFTTLQEAIAGLADFSRLSAEIAAVDADLQVKMSVLLKDADERKARRQAELDVLFARLKPWWETAGATVTQGKRRSAELGGCEIGVRLSPPKLAFDGKEADAIVRLFKARLRQFVRVKLSINKDALRDALSAQPVPDSPLAKSVEQLKRRLGRLSFRLDQRDEFYIQPLAPKRDDAASEDQSR